MSVARFLPLWPRQLISCQRSPILSPPLRHFSGTKNPEAFKFGSQYLSCKVRYYNSILSPWYLLRKMGVPQKGIIKFRRGLLRWSYPWVKYSLPIAFLMGIADIMAQLLCIDQDAKRKEYDFNSTIRLALIGFFLLGPVISKWNLYMYRRLRCHVGSNFILRKALADVFILTPLLLTATMIVYDYPFWSKAAWCEVERSFCIKYATPFLNIMKISILTRPIVALILCLLVASDLRSPLRKLYELAFAIFVIKEFQRAHLGLTREEYQKIRIDELRRLEAKRKKGEAIPPQHTSFCRCMQHLLGWLWTIECTDSCDNQSKNKCNNMKKCK